MRAFPISNLIQGPSLAQGVKAIAIAMLLAAPFCSSAGAVELVPHRAVYKIKLSTVQAGGNVVDARGLTTMALERGCDGWVIDQRLVMEVNLESGKSAQQEIRYSGWESLNAEYFRFSSLNRFDDDQENYTGSARLTAAGKAGKAIFKEPEAGTFDLPAGTLFPVSHTRLLIERAQAGDRQVERRVFDGTENKEPQQVVAFIGAMKGPDEHPYGAIGPLTRRPGWNIRMSFFEAGSTAAEPQFEMDMLQLDNGVAPRLILDYRDFSVLLELQRVEALPAPSC